MPCLIEQAVTKTLVGQYMTIKREAAFHEAGHAVAAHRSRFHNVVGQINLATYGAGEIYVSLSKQKLIAEGKPATPSAQLDKEVAKDLAVVLVAGLVAERLAQESDGDLKANPMCAEPDYHLMQQNLDAAGLSKKFNLHEEAAKIVLNSNWPLVDALAAYLFSEKTVASVSVHEFIEKWDAQHSA